MFDIRLKSVSLSFIKTLWRFSWYVLSTGITVLNQRQKQFSDTYFLMNDSCLCIFMLSKQIVKLFYIFLTLNFFILLELSWLSFPSLLKDLCLNNLDSHLLKHTLCLVWLKWPCDSEEENVKTILKKLTTMTTITDNKQFLIWKVKVS